MEQINPSFDQPQMQAQPQRPSFLNTLCILSFIMAGIMILLGIWNVINSFTPYKAEEIQGMQMMGIDPASVAKNPVKEIIVLLCQFISLGGVIMMWNLRKPGFFVYTAGEVLPWVIPYFFGGSPTAMLATFPAGVVTVVYVVVAIAIIIDIAFIAMYAANLKHMK